MTEVYLYIPHPDDETLQMGLAALYYLSLGLNVHFVFMSRGTVTANSVKLDGSGVCGWHNYTHNPTQEQYVVPTDAEIGLARFNEGKAAAGQMGLIAGAGRVYVHEGSLPTQYGGSDWQNPLMVAEAEAIMRSYVEGSSNSFHHTMSYTDRHPDHACLGHAMQNLKASADLGPSLTGSRYFVSRLYWDYSKYPDVATRPGLRWVSQSITNGRMAEYVAHLRSKVAPVYSAWCPGSAWGIGPHQVINQFYTTGLMPPTSTVGVDGLWHL